MKKITKAIFPVAGLGTRFLPATKVLPKEMLPVVDRPVIQYAVDEARAAGITEFIFVTSKGKMAIEDHFDHHQELEQTLRARKKTAQYDAIKRDELPAGSFIFLRQPEALGLGHAIWCARQAIGNEPFAVLLPDDVFLSRVAVLQQMTAAYERTGGNILATTRVPPASTEKYGILDLGADYQVDAVGSSAAPPGDPARLVPVRGMVEKPAPAQAPSHYSVVGRYILQPEILDQLAEHRKGAGNEIQLTDAIAALIGQQQVQGYLYDGIRYDCGDKSGFIMANLAFALSRPDLAPKIRGLMRQLLADDFEPPEEDV